MTREEAINKWIVPAIKNTWNEKKCNEILKALEQEPCDCITLRLEKGTLKYSEKDYVVYKKEWLKKWWQPELALLGIQPKEIYNKGWKDGAEATAYHVELCEKENPTIPMAVIENIKAEIQAKYDEIPYRYNHYDDGMIDGLEWVIGVIDKHIAESEDKE